MKLASSQQLRPQGPTPVQAHCTEVRSESWGGANGDGNRIGDWKEDGDGDGDENGDESGEGGGIEDSSCIRYIMVEAEHVWLAPSVEYGSTCLWSAEQGNIHSSLSQFAPVNLVSRDRFSRPVPRQPAHSTSLG